MADSFSRIAEAQKKVNLQDLLNRFAQVMADASGEHISMLYEAETERVIVCVGAKQTIFDVSANSHLGTIRDIFDKVFSQ